MRETGLSRLIGGPVLRVSLIVMAVVVPATLRLGLENGVYGGWTYLVAGAPFLLLALALPSTPWVANVLGIIVVSIVMWGEVEGWQNRNYLQGNMALLGAALIVYPIVALVALAKVAAWAFARWGGHGSPKPPLAAR